MYFATERSDEIVGLRVINNRLVVLLTGSVHRVNYLPFGGQLSALQGRVQEPIAGSVGCVGREAHTKVQTSSGEYVVWVSTRGLEMSNGVGWGDACPDWNSGEITGTASQVVLQANPSQGRIELYDDTTRWDFYYDETLLKNGKFRVIGPHTHDVRVRYATANQDRAWTSSTASVYREQVGVTSQDTVLSTGYIRSPDSRFEDLVIHSVGFTHSAAASTTAKVRAYGKLIGEAEVAAPLQSVPSANMALEETSDARISQMGNQLRIEITLAGNDSWALGPTYLDLEKAEGGNG